METEVILFWVYVALGPALCGLVAWGLLLGRQQLRLLSRPVRRGEGALPTVTVLVPAKDEGERMRACLESILAQDYPALQLVAINDRSTDQTGAIMDEMAAAHPDRMRVLHIPHEPLPAGWTGKCNALRSAAGLARGDWLLFVDSDVILEPDAVSATVGRAAGKDYDLFSILPRLEAHSFWEALIMPLGGAALSLMFMVSLANKDYLRRCAFANGQFLLIRRSVYEAVGGHEPVKGMFGEDVAMARLLKRQGYKTRISWGAEFASVRMYASLEDIRRGWARNYFAPSLGSPWRIIGAIVFLLLGAYSCYVALGWGIYRATTSIDAPERWAWLIAAGIHWLLMTLSAVVVYGWSSNRKRLALLLPLGLAMLMGIFFRALRMCQTRRVSWRGTSYLSKAASATGQG